MDFGDLIILVFIVTSILSSIAGGKKKQQAKKRPQARPQPRPVQLPQQRRVESAPGGAASAPAPTARKTEAAQTMEDILRQLGLDVGPQAEPEPEIEPEPAPVVREESPPLRRDRVGREIPQVRSLEENTADVVADRAGPVHRQFHEQYVKPYQQTRIEQPNSRARIHLNPRSLREAVILKEILGTPKGMQ